MFNSKSHRPVQSSSKSKIARPTRQLSHRPLPRPLTRLGHLGMLRLDHGGVALSGARVSFEHFDHLRSVWKHLGEQSVPRAGQIIVSLMLLSAARPAGAPPWPLGRGVATLRSINPPKLGGLSRSIRLQSRRAESRNARTSTPFGTPQTPVLPMRPSRSNRTRVHRRR